MTNQNLFTHLRAAFPADLEQTAVEVKLPQGPAHIYTWKDLDAQSARIANLLHPIRVEAGCHGDRLRKYRGNAAATHAVRAFAPPGKTSMRKAPASPTCCNRCNYPIPAASPCR